MENRISIVLPYYNPEKNWEEGLIYNMRKIQEMIGATYEFEIILVDDGSKEKTGIQIQKIQESKELPLPFNNL